MKISRIIILFLIILYSCSNNGFNIGHSHLDEQYRLLEIDYNNEPDESLTQIIRYSNIRKEGYGVLLNIEMATPKKKLQSIIDSFRK